MIVPAVQADCPAHRALSTEGVEHLTFLLDTDTGYADLVAHLWSQGEGFTVVEHDIAPWPGAVDAMEWCPEPWCVHWYPFAPNAIRPAMGMIRFSTELIQANPDLGERWKGVEWHQLDGKVYPAVLAVAGEPHRHLPDVAHLKEHPLWES